MAFCENCGTQLSASAKFCASCGTPAGQSAAPPMVASPMKSSGLSKTILGIAGAIIVLGCVGAGTAYYLVHRVTAKAAAQAQDVPDLNALIKALPKEATQAVAATATPESKGSAESTSTLDPNKIVTPEDGQCALFTKEELTQVLATTFTQADADATGCTYKGDAQREWVRTEALWKGGHKLVKEKSDNYKNLRQSMANLHFTKAEIDAHSFPIEPYPGVGDEAWVNIWNVVTARKGDVGITMDLRYYHDSEALTKMLTNTALSRLRDTKPDSPAKASESVQ